MASILELLQTKKLLICVGAGGVGKTSMAATLGLQGALQGRNVLVLTIDPAKRLAEFARTSRIGNDEIQIDIHSLQQRIVDQDSDIVVQQDINSDQKISQSESKEGTLWAMMLDGQHTFDKLIEKLSHPKNRSRRY